MNNEKMKKEGSRFAPDDEEASRRYQEWKSRDPFPKIEAALLNSADIEDYVAATGMIYPFDPQKLISASYEVCLDGNIFRWDSKGEEDFISIEDARGFTLGKNSIAFVYPKTKFRIPDYIALRFNLIIKHVHRGILLGTGPLVDPGFEGNLLIPLHNLTVNEYRFSLGEGLIWVEFTKTSRNERWTSESRREGFGQYKDFPDKKKNLDPKYYFENAAGGRPIRSSIPDVIQDSANLAKNAQNSAEEAAKKAESIEDQARRQIESIKEETRRQIKRIEWTAIIAAILAIGTILTSIYLGNRAILQLVENSIKYVTEEKEKINSQYKKLSERIKVLEEKAQPFDKIGKSQRPAVKKPGDSNIPSDEKSISKEKSK